MSNSPTLLIIDDEPQIRRLLEVTLKSSGYQTSEAPTAKEGLRAAAMHPPDMILLDLGLPDMDGQVVLTTLREWYISPIIILSVRSSESEIIKALDNGANDYLVKPFRPGELLARIRNSLRLVIRNDNSATIIAGNLNIDLANRIIKKDGNILKLTSTEFSLLSLLARNENRVLTHTYILKEIWGPGYIEQTQYLRVFIAQIRKKIEDNPNHPRIIITEPAIGYRFCGSEDL
jgi:two-component system, OmpR family, KDP operon response regulator KdpE